MRALLSAVPNYVRMLNTTKHLQSSYNEITFNCSHFTFQGHFPPATRALRKHVAVLMLIIYFLNNSTSRKEVNVAVTITL